VTEMTVLLFIELYEVVVPSFAYHFH